MRNAIAFIALILAAVAIAAVTTHLRPNTASPLPNEVPDTTTPAPAAKPAASTPAKPPSADSLKEFDAVKEGAVHATLVVANRGTMTLELYPKAAPKTVAHFVDLCKKNFYAGILFHRVEPDFVIQAGDPTSKGADPGNVKNLPGMGSHGSGSSVPLEAKLPHLAYTVGLARSQDPNSGDSQFYINLKDNPSLDGNYCIFGRVTSGLDVPSKIQVGDKIESLTIQ